MSLSREKEQRLSRTYKRMVWTAAFFFVFSLFSEVMGAHVLDRIFLWLAVSMMVAALTVCAYALAKIGRL